MYDNIKIAFESLIDHSEFQMLMGEYRQRFGIPGSGFDNSSSDKYRGWIKESLHKTDYLKDQFLFIAKRCRNLIPDRDPIPNVLLAYYFLFGKIPDKSSAQNESIFSINPSGILGSFDITFTIPLIFDLDDFTNEIEKHSDEIDQITKNVELVLTKLSDTKPINATGFDPKHDLLATTPGNGADIVDRVHRDMAYLVEFGRIVLEEHLQNMKDEDFVINTYEDKNKPIFQPVQHMGMFLLNRNLFSIAEEYWKQIDDEILAFNARTGRRVNRGIPLANTGVNQIAQGKVIEGLFNIYRGYNDDKECLQHLPNISIDPEKDMAKSSLFTQFEERQTSDVFELINSKYGHVFDPIISKDDLSEFIQNLNSDKKLLFYMTLYRFSFSLNLNNQLSTVVSRSEIVRSLAELALWFEDEMKRKDTSLIGQTLIQILDQKVGQINPTSGQYTNASNLNELSTKISNALASSSSLEIKNARIMGCLRNFAGHNLDVQDHAFFQTCDEVFARMLSFIIYSRSQSWI